VLKTTFSFFFPPFWSPSRKIVENRAPSLGESPGPFVPSHFSPRLPFLVPLQGRKKGKGCRVCLGHHIVLSSLFLLTPAMHGTVPVSPPSASSLERVFGVPFLDQATVSLKRQVGESSYVGMRA